jgi:predicted RNA-binding Zn ribbon-like protein
MAANSVADLPLVAGHPALDLVNTVEPREAGVAFREHLVMSEDVLVWARRAGMIDKAEADAVRTAWGSGGEPAVAATREIREALYTVLSGWVGSDGRPVTPAPADAAARRALDLLNAHWSAASGRAKLEPGRPGGPPARLALAAEEPGWLIPDRLVHAAVDLLGSLDPSQLRACPIDDGGCGWLFVDRSRNSTRRWCVMADCGAKAKARRLTARRRAARRGATAS